MTVALSAQDLRALREAIAAAVLATGGGLDASLENDPDAHLRLLVASRAAAEETGTMLHDAVAVARRAGHSWETVGGVLGISRQGAQQRFAPSPGSEPEAGAPERRTLTPLTSFTEMAVLEREGRRGWHVVDFGTLYHLVEASPWQWEHRRVPGAIGGRRHRLEAEGWEQVGGLWFPWAYYKRRTDRPAEA